MAFPKVKEEPDSGPAPRSLSLPLRRAPTETRVGFSLPALKQRLHGRSLTRLFSFLVPFTNQLCAESSNSYRPPKLPFRPPSHADGTEFGQLRQLSESSGEILTNSSPGAPAETISWPEATPFPRALDRPDLADFAVREPTNSSGEQTSQQPKPDSAADRQTQKTNMPRNRRSGRNFTLQTAPWGIHTSDNSVAEPAMPSVNGNQAGAQPARNMPAVTSARPASQRTRNGGNSDNGGNAPRASQRLSVECQRRSFNPEWILVQRANGLFSCDVKLLRHIVKGGRLFRSPEAAKSAVASKALGIIRTWPTSAEVAGEDCRQHIAGVMANRHDGRRRGGINTDEQLMMASDPRMSNNMHPAPAGRESEIGRTDDIDEFARALRDGLTEQTLADPIATRAFVESLAVGLLSAQQRDRSRSPAPVPRVAGGYRERSPPGFARASPVQSTLHSPAASETAWAGNPENANCRASQPVWRRRRDDSYHPNYPRGLEEERRNQFGQ